MAVVRLSCRVGLMMSDRRVLLRLALLSLRLSRVRRMRTLLGDVVGSTSDWHSWRRHG